jgi:hypothetical protein
VAGVTAAGCHFLGWSFVLLGSAGWSTCRLPRVLSALYLATGTMSLFAYLYKDFDLSIAPLVAVVSIWQGILLWKAESEETQARSIDGSQPNQA